MDILVILLLAATLALLYRVYQELRKNHGELERIRSQLAEDEQRFGELRAQVHADVKRESAVLFARLEAYTSLRERLGLRQGLPYTKDWSAAPDFLQTIVEHALEAKPALILECSSGLTTLMLARCCELNGGGKVLSLENGAEFADKTRGNLERYGLQGHADVIHAPLQHMLFDDREFSWYARDELPPGPIDMLVIDGPPGFIQPQARFPALPLLYERLADGCVIFLDDAARPDEREIVKHWLAAYPKLQHDYLDTERGCSVLVVRKGAPKPEGD